jgi:hypothetical protein
MAVDSELEESEVTLEERLAAAEEKIESLKRDVSQLGWGIFALVAAALVVVVLNGLVGDQLEPNPSNHDLKVEDLLSKGVHCYDSTQERAAARQRALAAIDRIQWEQDHPEPADPMFGSRPPPVKVPAIWDDAPQGESWDPSSCFEVMQGF